MPISIISRRAGTAGKGNGKFRAAFELAVMKRGIVV